MLAIKQSQIRQSVAARDSKIKGHRLSFRSIWDFACADLFPSADSVGWYQAAPFLGCQRYEGAVSTVSRRAFSIDCLVRHL